MERIIGMVLTGMKGRERKETKSRIGRCEVIAPDRPQGNPERHVSSLASTKQGARRRAVPQHSEVTRQHIRSSPSPETCCAAHAFALENMSAADHAFIFLSFFTAHLPIRGNCGSETCPPLLPPTIERGGFRFLPNALCYRTPACAVAMV
jgi:hypothetical protein